MRQYHEFLQLGYLSSREDTYNYLDYTFQSHLKDHSFEELLDIGYNLLLKEIDKAVSLNSNIIVPISGGLDSRLILSAVAECMDVTDIKTYTFGSPKALDYEIGNKIGKELNTNHQSINLLDYEYKIEDLYEFASIVNNPTVMFHNIPKPEFIENNSLIMSGFLGDVVSGKRSGFMKGADKEIKHNYFTSMVDRNEFTVPNETLINKLVDNMHYEDIQNLEEIEKIYILEHNFKLNSNQVFGNIPKNNMFTPFLNTDFMNFLLSLPKEYRMNQYFYKKLIFEKMPGILKKLPVRNYYGAKYQANKSMLNFHRAKNKVRYMMSERFKLVHNPHVNYVDFKKKIQMDNNFKKLLLILLYSLKERKIQDYSNEIEKSIFEIENNQLKAPYNYLLLCSLEIYIRNGNMNSNE